jgi:hypothetical protein
VIDASLSRKDETSLNFDPFSDEYGNKTLRRMELHLFSSFVNYKKGPVPLISNTKL